jgi:hypothetical protein
MFRSLLALLMMVVVAPANERVKESLFSLERGRRAPSWMSGRPQG